MRENFRQPRRASCRRVGAQKCPMWGQGIGARVVPRIVSKARLYRGSNPAGAAWPSTTKRSLVAVGRGANPAKRNRRAIPGSGTLDALPVPRGPGLVRQSVACMRASLGYSTGPPHGRPRSGARRVQLPRRPPQNHPARGGVAARKAATRLRGRNPPLALTGGWGAGRDLLPRPRRVSAAQAPCEQDTGATLARGRLDWHGCGVRVAIVAAPTCWGSTPLRSSSVAPGYTYLPHARASAHPFPVAPAGFGRGWQSGASVGLTGGHAHGFSAVHVCRVRFPTGPPKEDPISWVIPCCVCAPPAHAASSLLPVREEAR